MKSRLLAYVPIAALAMSILAGCQSQGSYDPNYSTDVKMTEEQKQKEKEIMEGQTAPNALPGGATQPQGLGPPPGKSGK